MTQWQKKETQSNTPDALSSSLGQPLLGQQGGNKRYAGRVVVELWDDGDQANDARNITFSADATDGNAGALLRRIAPALLKRSQGTATF